MTAPTRGAMRADEYSIGIPSVSGSWEWVEPNASITPDHLGRR